MNRKPESLDKASRPTGWACLGVVVPALCTILAAGLARGAEPELLIKFDPDPDVKFAKPDSEILLRANVEQKVFLAVQHPEGEKKNRTVVVEVMVDGKRVGDAVTLTLKPGDIAPVSFAKPKPPPKPEDKPMPAKPPEFKTLQGKLPFTFKVRLLAKAAKMGDPDTVLQTLPVTRILVPAEYLTFSSDYNFETGKLTVDVKAEDSFTGPPCNVELVLPKERLPEMVNAANQDGQFKAELKKAGDTKSLFVENLRFKLKEAGTLEGFFYLKVDGYDRAFIIRHDFGKKTGKNTGLPFRDPSLRLKAKPVFVSGQPYKFQLEVDYAKQQLTDMPSPDEVKLEIGLYRDEAMKTSPIPKFELGPSVRNQKLLYALEGPDGALVFKPEVIDWAMKDVGTEGVVGVRYLGIRLLDKNGKPIEWQTKGKVKETLLAKQKINFYDGAIPSPVEIVAPPKETELGKEITFRVKSREGDFKIKEAVIFLGKLPKDKMPPDSAEKLVKSTEEEGVWIAKLAMPEDKAVKKTIVTVLARGSFGEDALETVVEETPPIVLKPAPPRKPGGSLKVTVFLQKKGDLFDKVPVVLTLLEQGKAPRDVNTGDTNEKGVILFEGLAPGKYVVSSKHPRDSKMKGSAEVMVEVDKVVEANYIVKRQIK